MARKWKWQAQQILSEESFPVCSPRLLAEGPALRSPRDLINHTIVRTVSPLIADEWSAWLQLATGSEVQFKREMSCSSLFLSTTAVLHGLGIGMGRTSLSRDDLAAGRLVEPFGIRLPSESSYYVLNHAEKADLPKVRWVGCHCWCFQGKIFGQRFGWYKNGLIKILKRG